MEEVMEYKGYIGSIEFSEKDNVFFGKVVNAKDLISYEGIDTESLQEDFISAVDDYLNLIQ